MINPRLSIDDAKSYATEENLIKALVKHGIDKDNPLIVRNREGRWTAVFCLNHTRFAKEGGYIAMFAQYGFLTVN